MGIRTFIFEQPEVIETVFQTFSADLPTMTSAPTIYLVGSGTSLNALIAVGHFMKRSLEVRIQICGPLAFMEETVNKVDSHCMAIILSQSGASTTTIAAVEHARQCGMQTLTLTADDESPIAVVSDNILLMPVGIENVGPKTKGYTASVLCLLLMTLAMTGRKLPIRPFPRGLAGLIEKSDSIVRDLAIASQRADFIMIMGQERHVGTALEGALKISEMSGVAAAAFDTEEAFHGRFHSLGPQSLAIFVAATWQQFNLALNGANVLSDLGVPVRILNLGGKPASSHDLILPWPQFDSLAELDLIPAIIPFQLLAWHLANQKGMVPDKMRYPDLSKKLQIKTSEVGR